jgi:hypothetical protein
MAANLGKVEGASAWSGGGVVVGWRKVGVVSLKIKPGRKGGWRKRAGR